VEAVARLAFSLLGQEGFAFLLGGHLDFAFSSPGKFIAVLLQNKKIAISS
jgi:hypothetical protein